MMINMRCLLVFAIIACYCAKENAAQRGTACRTPNGRVATCTSIFECPRFVSAIQNRIKSQIRFIQQSQCGWDTDALVCCGNEVDFVTTSKPPADSLDNRMMTNNFVRNRAVPTRSSCGFQDSDNKVEGFIVGGKETQIDEFPWMASLGYTDSNGYRKWACGGTLIASRYVLTAAHCVVGEVERRVGRLSVIKLGEHDTKTEVDCIKSKCNDAPVTVNVEQIITHPDYDKSLNSPNDLALVRLDRSVQYTKYIRPICLPELNEETTSGVNITTAGWGRTEFGVPSTVLLKVNIPIVNKALCSRQYLAQGVNLVDSQICAGGEGGKDSCSGDSGGPLMRRSDSNVLQWFQEGIVSFGSLRCGIKGLPAVYTKVSSFVPWIHSTIRD